MNHYLTPADLAAFRSHLQEEERSPGTIDKYGRDLRAFVRWLAGRTVNKERVSAWKSSLQEAGYAPTTVNAMLASVHSFFAFAGWGDYRVKYLRIQRRLFRDTTRELTRADYERLVGTACARGQRRLALVIETIAATGIRVSELRYITVEAARDGRADIALKGKIRTILIPAKLRRKLLQYAKKQKTASGEIFLTRSGKSLSRRQIWAELKRLCKHAGVEPKKVFPHNLRHLFAVTYYKASNNIARLADVLGHSSIETTRIYLITSGQEHARDLERLGLVT
ncbi:MAG: tyrosine-type recombinase/integrase [Peptococcaceae bacterium]|nr:tyrosine-type recombinase/integrase [Peptococcaceae bacterium]